MHIMVVQYIRALNFCLVQYQHGFIASRADCILLIFWSCQIFPLVMLPFASGWEPSWASIMVVTHELVLPLQRPKWNFMMFNSLADYIQLDAINLNTMPNLGTLSLAPGWWFYLLYCCWAWLCYLQLLTGSFCAAQVYTAVAATMPEAVMVRARHFLCWPHHREDNLFLDYNILCSTLCSRQSVAICMHWYKGDVHGACQARLLSPHGCPGQGVGVMQSVEHLLWGGSAVFGVEHLSGTSHFLYISTRYTCSCLSLLIRGYFFSKFRCCRKYGSSPEHQKYVLCSSHFKQFVHTCDQKKGWEGIAKGSHNRINSWSWMARSWHNYASVVCHKLIYTFFNPLIELVMVLPSQYSSSNRSIGLGWYKKCVALTYHIVLVHIMFDLTLLAGWVLPLY
jgi:hypothetical protein